MGELAFAAVGACAAVYGGEKVVAAALGSALFGVAPFRIRHCDFPSICLAAFYSRSGTGRGLNLATALLLDAGG